MDIIEILFSADLWFGLIIQGLLIVLGIVVFEFLHLRLQNSILELAWDKVGMPLYRAFVIVIFVMISYPTIFGLLEAPHIFDLVIIGDGKITRVINILFILGFALPFIPVLGKHTNIVLLLQSLLCCMFVFSWLADHLGAHNIHYFPDMNIALIIAILAVASSYLANWLSLEFGEKLNKRFHLEGCEQLIAPTIALFIQAPIILLYSSSLGRQLI